MQNAFDKAALFGVVPVINIPEENLAEPLAKALIDGGLPLIEVTLRNESALRSLERIKKAFPEMCAGAGTVISVNQVDAALAVGADFIVTPGLNSDIVSYCQCKDIPVLPGCVTATEIEAGIALGLSLFKFFPAEKMGGLSTIKELCGPYRNIKFIPTSGMSFKNLSEYMACDKIAAVGGSFMAPAALVGAQDWEGITALCREAVRTVHGFHLAHIGINGTSGEEGAKRAQRFAEIFDLPYKAGGRSDFAGTILESGKMKFPGEKGHIAIGTHSVERAIAYLEGKGIKMREEFLNVNEQGVIIAAYLEEELNGFAIHLLRKS